MYCTVHVTGMCFSLDLEAWRLWEVTVRVQEQQRPLHHRHPPAGLWQVPTVYLNNIHSS